MEIVLTCQELSKYTGHNKYEAKNIVIDKLKKDVEFKIIIYQNLI